jgi:hypothetical protein
MADHLSNPPVRLFDCSIVVFNTGLSLVANRINRRVGCPRISQQRRNQDINPIKHTSSVTDTLIDAIDPQAIWVSREVVTNGSESLCVTIPFNVLTCHIKSAMAKP